MQHLSRAEAEQEIIGSCEEVRDLTGQSEVPFAFPYTGVGLDRAWLADVRRRAPFVGVFFDTGGLCAGVPFVVQRIGGDGEAYVDMPTKLRGIWMRKAAWNRQ